jgi:hypothetical protein
VRTRESREVAKNRQIHYSLLRQAWRSVMMTRL